MNRREDECIYNKLYKIYMWNENGNEDIEIKMRMTEYKEHGLTTSATLLAISLRDSPALAIS